MYICVRAVCALLCLAMIAVKYMYIAVCAGYVKYIPNSLQMFVYIYMYVLQPNECRYAGCQGYTTSENTLVNVIKWDAWLERFPHDELISVAP